MKQSKGGAIGLQLTQAIAKIVMQIWEDKMIMMMKENKIDVYMFRKYVDDVNIILEALGMGVRWCDNEKRMKWMQEWEEEDKESNIPRDQITMREMVRMSNSLYPWIQFTMDVESVNK